MKEQGYSIKDLEILSGIKAHTIRIWEKRYNLLNPHRTDTNIRFYTDEDLRRMLNISMLVKNGLKISKVATLNDTEIKEKVLMIADTEISESDYLERLMMHMLNFDNVGFYNLTNNAIEKFGFEDAVFKIFFPLFERIGTFWQVGSIFPAQEHYVTNIFRQKVITEIDKLGMNTWRNRNILFFLPEDEMHEMSLLFYAYMAQKYGYNVIYLGQFVPFVDLQKIQEHKKVDYVFTSFINSISKEELNDYLLNLKELFNDQKIFITGYQVKIHNPELPRNVKVIKDYREFKKYMG